MRILPESKRESTETLRYAGWSAIPIARASGRLVVPAQPVDATPSILLIR